MVKEAVTLKSENALKDYFASTANNFDICSIVFNLMALIMRRVLVEWPPAAESFDLK